MKLKKLFFLNLFLCFNLFAKDLTTISVRDLQHQINSKTFKGIIVDVRTPFEWKESGIIKNSILLNAYDPQFSKKFLKLPKDKTYYLICHSGVRSKFATEHIQKKGFNVVNVSEGISIWIKNKFPLTKLFKPFTPLEITSP